MAAVADKPEAFNHDHVEKHDDSGSQLETGIPAEEEGKITLKTKLAVLVCSLRGLQLALVS